MGNYIDRLFFSLIDEIKGKDKDGIYFNMFLKFKMLPIATQLSIQQFLNQFQYWGKIEIEYDNYEMLRLKAKVFDEHIDELEELYKNLKDYKSMINTISPVHRLLHGATKIINLSLDYGVKTYMKNKKTQVNFCVFYFERRI